MRTTHAQGARYSIAVAGASFGWGSVGKLAAVLDVIRTRHGHRVDVVGLDTHLGRAVLANHVVSTWLDTPALDDAKLARVLAHYRVRAAVVVLDAELATRLESIGCPVVYVDSLPFLWTENDYVPKYVSRYCAQLCLVLPQACWATLRSIKELRWVGAVVTPYSPAPLDRHPGRALINLGGLYSPFSSANVEAYLELLLSPVLRVLREQGFHHVTITGNLDVRRLPIHADAVRDLTISGGRLGHQEFLRQLQSADIIVTSPGRTTLLEIAAIGQRAVVLPPQNLSQILNAADIRQAVDPGIVLSWPTEVIDVNGVLLERVHGEEAAVRMLYRQITAARAQWSDRLPGFMADFTKALTRALAHGTGLSPMNTLVGNNGAEMIVDSLEELILGPTSTPSAAPV